MAPTVSTYHAYAASLVADHALRLGIEPATRLLGEAGRWQLAHDVVERWGGDLDTDLAASTVTGAVLDLADGLAEHLAHPRAAGGVVPPGRRPARGGALRWTQDGRGRGREGRGLAAAARGPGPVARRARGAQALARPDGLRRPGGAGGTGGPRGARGGRGGAGPVLGGPARRVPGHLRRAARSAASSVRQRDRPRSPAARRRPPGDRCRGPSPVDLRLARGERGRAVQVPRGVPPRHGGRAAATRRCSRCPSRGATTWRCSTPRTAWPSRCGPRRRTRWRPWAGGRKPDRAWWPRPSRRTSTTRWPSWPGSSPSTGSCWAGAARRRLPCCAASVRSSRAWRRRCAPRGCRWRSSGWAGC